MPCTGSSKSGQFDHVVLLVAAQPVLRTEGRGDLQIAAGEQAIERMREVFGDRSRMREQGHAPAGQRGTQSGVGEQPIDAEPHGGDAAASVSAKQSE